jgi:phosphoribosylaminoimidazolecarboxamide formyltransferase/IMP cyclohydrolase
MDRKITRALISLSDKQGLIELASGLRSMGVEILSTGGTARALKEAGISVQLVEDYTGFPEMLDGRVKTLHPKIHGGILFQRDNPAHVEQAQSHGIEPIDLLVVNLYPFEEASGKAGITFEELVEQIDIGGPTMIRAAAKNHHDVAVVVNPKEYGALLAEMQATGGLISEKTRLRLAAEVFRHTAYYDSLIARFLTREAEPDSAFPDILSLPMRKVQGLRYGENPHQGAAFYQDPLAAVPGLAGAKQRHGKELSYNNLMDADAAWGMALRFERPFAVVVKHANPCGAAVGDDIAETYRRAYDSDPQSAFGGIVAVNRPVNQALADALCETFLEVVLAPGFDTDALASIQARKKNLRLIEMPAGGPSASDLVLRRVLGGYLAQEPDLSEEEPESWEQKVGDGFDADLKRDLDLAWKLVRHVKSNAIVLVRDGCLIAAGPGQTSRVGAVEICLRHAGEKARGAVLASDAFFPFSDGPKLALDQGVRAIVHPGGSKRDQDTIDLCTDRGVPLFFTGRRHFLH